MGLLVKITLGIVLILGIAAPFGVFAMGEKSKGRYEATLTANLLLFFDTMMFAAVVAFSDNAQAAEAGSGAVSTAGVGYLSAAPTTGLSCLGGGIAISATVGAASGVTSGDSFILGRSLIFVSLAEGVCLYGLTISFVISEEL